MPSAGAIELRRRFLAAVGRGDLAGAARTRRDLLAIGFTLGTSTPYRLLPRRGASTPGVASSRNAEGPPLSAAGPPVWLGGGDTPARAWTSTPSGAEAVARESV